MKPKTDKQKAEIMKELGQLYEFRWVGFGIDNIGMKKLNKDIRELELKLKMLNKEK